MRNKISTPNGLLVGYLGAMLLATALPADAVGQLTVRTLIGNAVTDVDGPQYQEVADAIVRFRNRDFEGARQLLLASVEKNTRLAPADVMIARMYIAAKQIPAGRNSLEASIKTDPRDPEALLIFGEMAFRDRRFTEAGLLFGRAVELCEEYTENEKRKRNLQIQAYAGTSAVAEAREDWASAQPMLEAWIEIEPENTVALTRLGRALFKQEDYQGAYARFQKAYQTNNEMARPEINMGLLYEQGGKRANAEKLIALAVKRDGDSVNTRLAAAQWFLEAGLVQEARENAQAALKIESTSSQAQMLIGMSARYEGEYQAAADAFETVHLESPSNFAAINQLALSLIEQTDESKRRRSVEYAQINTRTFADLQQANGREAAVTMAWILFRLGRQAEAGRGIQSALRSGGVGPESSYFAAHILHDSGLSDAAKQVLKPTLTSKTMFPSRVDAENLAKKMNLNL